MTGVGCNSNRVRKLFDELSAKLFDFLLPCSTESQIFDISGDELIISKTYIHTTSSKPHHLLNIHTYLNDELISGRPLNETRQTASPDSP
jgi:hypothetical protein